MAVELRPSSTIPLGELAALFTAGYEGYSVPFQVDEPTLAYMVDVFDLDLDRSLVAFEEAAPVGLANVGLRGVRTWLGGVGVVRARRRAGLGERLTRSLLDRAREAGATEMVLEVIVENTPAIALYEKLGFAVTRELEVILLAADATGGTAEDVPVGVAQALIAARRDGPEPWQRDDRIVENLLRREPPPQALALGDAAAIFRADGGRVNLIQAAGGDGALRSLVAAIRARGQVTALNYPAGGAVAAVLAEAGGKVTLRQLEMAAEL